MSGHSKWAQIKRKKEVTDKKRGQIFSKLLRAISIAAQKDPNPNYNPNLKAAVDRAREANTPQDNIERAIKKSSEAKDIKEVLFEAYGPEAIAFLIQAQTDNSNRTVAEVKKILNNHGGKWASPGSVMWVFEKTVDGYQSKFPQNVSREAKERIIKLMEALDDQDDITEIYTSANIESEL
jgi:YebC/PmpR family DNA-binding regulatory protein